MSGVSSAETLLRRQPFRQETKTDNETSNADARSKLLIMNLPFSVSQRERKKTLRRIVIIVAVNGVAVEQSKPGSEEVIRQIRSSEGKPLTLTVKRGDAAVDITATPRMDGGEARLGFYQSITFEMVNQRLSLFAAIGASVDENLRILRVLHGARRWPE